METTLEAIEKKCPQIVKLAEELVIKRDNIETVTRWIQHTILDAIRQVKSFFDPDIEKANKLHKSLCAKRKAFLDPLELAERIARNKISFYLEVERRHREEEESKLREQAEREAEKERQKIVNQAVKAEKRGDTERADDLLNKAETVQAPAVTIIPKKVEGLNEREDWYFEIEDPALIPTEYWIRTLNEKLLISIAKNTKGTMQIPGIIFKKKITSVFSKR